MIDPAQIGQTVKQQYPGVYDQYPDEVVGQRALLKNPSLANGPLAQDAVSQAFKEATVQPGSMTNDLLTNPVTQAHVLPAALGTAGALSGIPMGGSLGTGAGNLIADAALKSYGKSNEIPSIGKQALGTGLAAVGDLTAIPAINKRIFGGQVGQAETAAGVPPPQEIPSLPKPKAGDPVSGGIDEAINSVSDAINNGGAIPTYWKQIKDQIDSFYDLGKDAKMTPLDRGKLQWLNAQVQKGLNSSVLGRAEPAANLAMSQVIPNAKDAIVNSTPTWLKYGLATGASALGLDSLKNALGGIFGNSQR